mgnify:CR=1 FL=1
MASKKLNNIFIKDAFSVAGPVERKGSIKNYDLEMDDYYYKEKTFEQAEIKMQRVVIDNVLQKNHLLNKDIDVLVSGDLSNQISVSCYAASHYKIPFFGVYSACASFVESLIVASELIENKRNAYAICVTSSHNLNAEKQFRYPIEYGAPKPLTTTFTATGAVATCLSKEKTNVKVESYTMGEVIDKGIKDASFMGAVMAPAAAHVLVKHLEEMKRNVDYYDLVLSGDLGCVGASILKEYLKRAYNIKMKKYLDSGCELYLKSQEETFSGASGPVALPLYLFNKILKEKKYSKILIIGTGSLHNPTIVNQKMSIPAVAHAISLEVTK